MKFISTLGPSAAFILLSGCLGTGSLSVPVSEVPASRQVADDAGALLYVSTGSATQILTYPKGKVLATFGHGEDALCSDGSGNVYATAFHGVDVYRHGATAPFRTLKLPYDFPEDCSVDPSSGDLAVAIACLSCDTSVVVFRRGRGTGKAYAAGMIGQQCGYDNRGNLFVAGDSSGAMFVELPKGSKKFTAISFNPPIPLVGGHIQWDGHYLAIENAGTYGEKPAIYQVTISGSTGSVVATTPLSGAYNVIKGWIDGDRAVVPFIARYYGAVRVGYWKYPEGGSPEKVLLDRRYRFRDITSLTVSAAPNRR